MDWLTGDAAWTSHDLGIFEYERRPTVVLRKLESDATLIKDVLEEKDEWENWFCDALGTTVMESGLYVILCSRAPPVFDEKDAPVSYVSVTRDTWERITRFFHVHRGITRSISREVAFFSSFYEEGKRGKSNISFTARMSSYLPRDLALSLTYVPSTDSTFAVVYGCNDNQVQEIERRIQSAGEKTKYPLLMIGLFTELERDRLVTMIDTLVDGFTLRSDHLESPSWNPATDMSNEKTQEYLALCLQSQTLVDHIRAVKRQLSKLMIEVDEFGNHFASSKGEGNQHGKEKARRFKKTGSQMKKRLQDITNEYDDKIDECKMVVENTTLALQTVYNQIARHDSDLSTKIAQANTTISLEMKQESAQMRSIALLTMIYLPSSSVAAIFSMDMFNWNPQEGEVVSKYIWVFAVFAVGLTTITFFAWHHITSWRGKKSDMDISGLQGKIV
ncbi:hypothetical protein F4804DRAFT_117400 [Jackrogersella minutella]|nr:hypothetical protein F4804DRAFT_117400 [Jackrogersella minutella]